MPNLALARGFPAADESQWRALVEKALRGADFETALGSETYDGIRIAPLYSHSDETPSVVGDAISRLEPDHAPWDILQLHAEPDAANANSAILADLEGGTTSIALRIEAPEQSGLPATESNFARALEGVDLNLAGIVLEPGGRFEPASQALQALWRARGVAGDKVAGGFGADPLGTLARTGGLSVALDQALDQTARLAALSRDGYPRMTSLMADGRPYHDGGASEAQELACLCATTVAYLRALESAGVSPEDGLAEIAFALAADGDQFLTIAKLRAARALVARIAEASGAASDTSPIRLHAQTSARMLARRDPHVNLLRTTVACAAAAMGGADAITVLPYSWAIGLPDAFARRIARNIQIILQEESSLGHVVDPASGSWYVETLTDKLARKAWDLFQGIESQGGMADALAKGWVQAMLRDTAEKRARNVALAKEELTGITAFPDPGDVHSDAQAHPVAFGLDDPAITVEPVPLRRPAAPFEVLRDASDAHYRKTGARPTIFLANLGEPADFTERARYARNVFAAGGIAAEAHDGFETAEDAAAAFEQSHAKLACLCSSDVVYEEQAEPAAKALKTAGAAHVYLAGRPGDRRGGYKDAGIGTFIHRGVDILEVLAEAHSILEIES